MTDREYTKAVQAELQREGFKEFKINTRNRFFARRNDVWYEFRIKFCRVPRRLKMMDVGFMTGLMNPNTVGVLISNGIDMTKFVETYLANNGVNVVVLNWEPGINIADRLSVS